MSGTARWANRRGPRWATRRAPAPPPRRGQPVELTPVATPQQRRVLVQRRDAVRALPPPLVTPYASAINPDYPVYGNPTTQSVRDNFSAAKSEIEALQTGKLDQAAGDARYLQLTGGSLQGPGTLNIFSPETGPSGYGANIYLDSPNHWGAFIFPQGGNASYAMGAYNGFDFGYWDGNSWTHLMWVRSTYTVFYQSVRMQGGAVISGGNLQMSGNVDVLLSRDPTANLHAASKQYVDGKLASAGIPDAPANGNAYMRLNNAWSSGGNLNGNLGVAGSISTGANILTGPPHALATLIGNNFTQSSGETDFWNQYGTGFQWYVVDTSNVSHFIAGLDSGGNLKLQGAGVQYYGIPGGGNVVGFIWAGGWVNAYVDGNRIGNVATSEFIAGNYLATSGGTVTGHLSVQNGLAVTGGAVTATNGFSTGNISLNPASGTTPGYVEFWAGSGNRAGYAGFEEGGAGSNLVLGSGSALGWSVQIDPTVPMGIATKQYVDSAVSAGGSFVDAPNDGHAYMRANAGWHSGGTLTGGLSFGATTVANANDLTRHISLFDGFCGFSVTGGTLNAVTAGNFNVVNYADNTNIAQFANSVIYLQRATQVTGPLKAYGYGGWGAFNQGQQLLISSVNNPGMGISDSSGGNWIGLHNMGGTFMISAMPALTDTTTPPTQWLSVGNQITAHVDFSGQSISAAGAIAITSAGTQSPSYRIFTEGNGADNNIWDWFVAGTGFVFRAINDAYNSGTAWLQATRSGMTITNVDVYASYIGTHGELVTHFDGDFAANTSPLQVTTNTASADATIGLNVAGNVATQMGLDRTGLFRIGGWSWAQNRLTLDGSGNMAIAGTGTASQFLGTSGNGGDQSAFLAESSGNSTFSWHITSAPADTKKWDMLAASNGTFYCRLLSDDESGFNTWLTVTRSATVSQTVNLTGQAINLQGTVSTRAGFFENRIVMAANNLDLATGSLFTKTISGATTFTVSNVPAAGTVATLILDLTNGGSAAITWWANVRWSGGTAPTLTASGRDILGFFSHDGGANWNGLLLGKGMA